jgi:hypothetical protein
VERWEVYEGKYLDQDGNDNNDDDDHNDDYDDEHTIDLNKQVK